ncbi:MAG: sugar phosphate isomerase/epimerase [Acidobacteriota bacterium]|nr:sugar phosphate isomerase/epimerase [Acidobacteriota bacterium]
MQTLASRRTFFGAAAGFLTLAKSGGAASAPQPNDLKLGVASYSFREFQRKLAIEDTKKLNVSYINIKDVHLPLNSTPDEIAKARKEFDKAGLTILGGGNITFAKTDEADIRHKFEYAKAAGMPLIVCAPTHEILPKMEKYVKEYNIKIAVHNHGPEDKNFPTPQSVLEAVKNMDPRCGLCMDIGHSARTGVDVVKSVHEAGSRLLDMHVKDLADLKNKDSQVPVGDGAMPIVAIFKELKQMNYQGGVMLEYEVQGDDPLPGMQKSFAYMRGVLAGLRG